ncbi:hypothetical protein GTZ78_18495 [Streptomyces sp. SID8361]|uniref:hypothetical protein n=1 Tax=Streptomyces sp. MnatMP-M27 TaxID=1839768 RepID=UPI000B8660DF|nr:hypothetical protein [Streptomyces sp. MnatMP-M27]MYU12632.1 hypothetical protein [Streptomyces sp. SID8361]
MKRQLSRRLSEYLAEAAQAFRKLAGERADLYLAGSLARSEGAVEPTVPGYRLASDLDFVAVTETPEEQPELVARLLAHLSAFDADFLPTCFVLGGGQAAGVRSHFGHDLWLGSRYPVVRDSSEGGPSRPAIGRQEMLEVVVHQLANYLLVPPGPANSGTERGRVTLDHHLRKLQLELLRANVPVTGDDVLRYADLPAASRTAPLEALVSPESVRELVRSRELSLRNPDTAAQSVQRVLRLLSAFFARPGSGVADSDGLLAALHAEGSTRGGVLWLFQLCLIAYFTLFVATGAVAREAASVVLALWRRLDTAELREAREITGVVASLNPGDLTDRTAARSGVLHQAMTLLRLDYYHYLGPLNFGRIDYPGYSTPRGRE